jgi:uncharacterized protein YraI
MLAGLVTAMALATAAVFVIDSGTGEDRQGRVVAARGDEGAATTAPTLSGTAARGATTIATATVTATGTPRRTVRVRADGTANVRAGPGVAFAILTTLETGDEAPASARNVDGDWLLLDLPGGTGWVAVDVVAVMGDVRGLPVSDALGALRVTSPTATVTPSSTRTTTPSTTRSNTATPTRTPTPTPAPAATTMATATASPTGARTALPDLVLTDATRGPGGRLVVVISNAGPGMLTARRVSVIGIDDAGTPLFGELTAPLTIAPGSAANVELAYRPQPAATLTIVLNADGAIEELTTANNRRRVTLGP